MRSSSEGLNANARALPIFITELHHLAGAERALLALSRWLWERQLPHYLLTYADTCDFAHFAAHPVDVVAIHPEPGAAGRIKALRQHFRERLRSASAPIFSGYQPALHGTLAGIRGFHTLMHDTPALFGDALARPWLGKVRMAITNRVVAHGLRSGGVTIVTSEFLREQCTHNFGVEAEIVRMGGLGSQQIWKPERSKDAALQMLSVCRMEANKRIDWILRALGRMEREAVTPLGRRLSDVVDWQLHLVGEGSMMKELSGLAEALGLGGRVHFHGHVSDEELERLYGEADLFLMPAVQGYGIPAIEALRRGIPVLLHRESGVSDILLETPWAEVLEGGEEAMLPQMAEMIQRVLTGGLRGMALPWLPTEDEWAAGVAERCGILQSGV